MAELKPCPKCGGKILAKGRPIKVATQRIIPPFISRMGICCVRCGYWKHSIKAWNRRADNG